MKTLIITITIELPESQLDLEKIDEDVDYICDKALHKYDVIRSSFKISEKGENHES